MANTKHFIFKANEAKNLDGVIVLDARSAKQAKAVAKDQGYVVGKAEAISREELNAMDWQGYTDLIAYDLDEDY